MARIMLNIYIYIYNIALSCNNHNEVIIPILYLRAQKIKLLAKVHKSSVLF